MASDIIER